MPGIIYSHIMIVLKCYERKGNIIPVFHRVIIPHIIKTAGYGLTTEKDKEIEFDF